MSLPLVGLVVLFSYRDYRHTMDEARIEVARLAETVGTGTLQFTSTAETQLAGIAEVLARNAYDADTGFSAEACAALAPDLRDAVAFLLAVNVVDRQGDYVCSTIGLPIPELPHARGRPWFQRMQETQTFSFGPPQQGVSDVEWVSVLSAPIFGSDGEWIGGITGGIDLVRFEDLLAGVTVPPHALVTIVDRESNIIARSVDPEMHLGGKTPPEETPTLPLTEHLGVSWGPDIDGVERTWGRLVLPGLGWKIYVGLPTADIVGPARTALYRRSAAGLLIALVGLGLALLLYRRVSRSIRQLVLGTRAAAGGALVQLPPDTPVEVAEVGHQLNRTLAARSEAEESERRARENFRSIFEHAAFGICLASWDGEFLEVNPALVNILGYDSAEELVAVPAQELYPDPDTRSVLTRTRINDDVYRDIEVDWLRKDGTLATVRLNGRVLHTRDGDVFVTVVEDVTGVRDLENQLRQTQKMEAVGRLAGGVAHDFNNLLTVIIGHARMILDKQGTDPENRDDTEQILAASERAALLTQQLLAFSRKQTTQTRPVELNAVLARLQQMLTRLIGEDITLINRFSPGLGSVVADPVELEQVVVNLVVNARDAMPKGGAVTLRTLSRRLEPGKTTERAGLEPGDYVVFSVSDTGVGMDPAIMEHAFEPFFTTKPVGKGTGLGLSTVYGIVRQAGGAVTVTSEPGVGSTFEVLLPMVGDGEEVAKSDANDPLESGAGRTILVVEDEDDVRTILVRMLNRAGYQVLEASDPSVALRLSESHPGPIHLTVTDMVMPIMRGSELADRLAEQRPGMPFLFISGYTGEVVAPDRLRQDPDAFLPKPFGPKQLLARVANLLDRAAASPSAGGPPSRPSPTPDGPSEPAVAEAHGPGNPTRA